MVLLFNWSPTKILRSKALQRLKSSVRFQHPFQYDRQQKTCDPEAIPSQVDRQTQSCLSDLNSHTKLALLILVLRYRQG